ncbi:recombinase family protein [Listeria innocua]|nr:recombinase family protein [Listeria innocua]EIU0523727.1 recombinase family protein [Listeria innocua]
MRLFSYDRTSEWDETKVSNEAQWSKCKTEATTKFGRIPIRYKDYGRSGGSQERPGFLSLWEEVKRSNEEGILYIWRYDRIARNVSLALEFMASCYQHQITIISISEPLPEGAGEGMAARKLFVQTLFIFGEMQRNVIIENTRAGLAYKKSKRQYISSSVPFGYRLLDGKVIQVADEADIVRLIYALYNSQKYGYNRLAKKLNMEGYLFRNRDYQGHHIAAILSNTLYYGGIKGGTFGSYIGDFEPIISEANYRKAQDIRVSRQVKKKDEKIYLLRGKIGCPFCKKRLSPKFISNGPKAKRHYYYYCSNNQCRGIYIHADRLEQKVIKSMHRFIHQNDVYQEILEEIYEKIQGIDQKKQRLNRYDKKSKKELIQAFETGEISLKDMKCQFAAIEQRQSISSSTEMLTSQNYESQLDFLMNLRTQTMQKLIVREIGRVEINKNKEVTCIYLESIQQNIHKEGA